MIKKFLKKKGIKIISIIFLFIGGCIFLISIPKIISTAFVKSIDWLTGDTSTKVQRDPEGNVIYEDGRNTIMSFGTRKQFEIVKFASGEYRQLTPLGIRWCLFDRDNNKSIDPDIEGYHCSPCVYEKDGKGYECESPYVYTKGKNGYTKLNFETAEIKQSQDISDFSEEDQEIFKGLDAGKGRVNLNNK